MQGKKPDTLFWWPDYIAENKVKLPMPFLWPEQMDTTELDATKPEIRAQEPWKDRDLEQAIREAQEWDTAMDKGNMQQTDGL